MRDYDRIICHRDGTVTVWDCYAQAWDRTRFVEARVLASFSIDQRDRVMRHLAKNRLRSDDETSHYRCEG